MVETQERLGLLASELEKRDVAYLHVGDSAGPEVAVAWHHFRLMVAWEPSDRGYDWQLLNGDGQVCAGSWRAESVDQIAYIIKTMTQKIYAFDRDDAHLHAVLISAGIPATYEHTGGGCHNVEVRLTEDCYIVFGTFGGEGERPVGWELRGPDFDVMATNKEPMSPEDLAPHVKNLVAFFALRL
ncbi:hypothetical protein AB0O47_20010 [Streptomyces noursei]|uniref:hypothetical protein n=1 Tax=Streptomyces noursei TaxID=1971 RepID=UPI00344C923A